jgi:hypothetical protein
VSETTAPGRKSEPWLRLVARTGPPLGLVFGSIGGLAALVVGLLHLDRLPMALCYVKAFTGLPCPTCGSTRAVGRLFALDVPGALSMNPLATLAAFALAAWAVADLALLPRRQVLRVAAVAAILLNWAYLLAAGR